MRTSTKWIIAGSVIGLGLATSLASRAHSAQFTDGFTDGASPPCGANYPLFSLDNTDAGAAPIRWEAFPYGSAIDFRAMDYRARITDPLDASKIWNFNIEQTLVPDPSGQPDAFQVLSHWVCADLYGILPTFHTKIWMPDSVRVGRQLGTRSSQGTYDLWIEAPTSGPNAGRPVLFGQGLAFQYPRVPIADFLRSHWGEGWKLFKTAASTYELRLRKVEMQGGLQFEHSLKLKLVVPGSSADH